MTPQIDKLSPQIKVHNPRPGLKPDLTTSLAYSLLSQTGLPPRVLNWYKNSDLIYKKIVRNSFILSKNVFFCDLIVSLRCIADYAREGFNV